MKSISSILIAALVLGIMIATNPTIEDYSNHLRQEIVSSAKEEDDLSKELVGLLGGLAGGIMANMTTRRNYLIFSTYTTEFDAKSFRCIGILGNFVGCGELSEMGEGH